MSSRGRAGTNIELPVDSPTPLVEGGRTVLEAAPSVTEHARIASTTPQLLPSGNVAELCADCGTLTVATTIDDLDAACCACKPIDRQYVYLVELVCMLCARRLGDAVAASSSAPIYVSALLRCPNCGGQPSPSGDVSCRDITEYPTFADSPPRRGRPPRWLVDQRRLERSARRKSNGPEGTRMIQNHEARPIQPRERLAGP
jgi:hypothetical protein